MHGPMYDWYEHPKFMEGMFTLAEETMETYPDQRIIAVGQSMAWLCTIQSMLMQARGEPDRTQIIPFSGQFLKRETPNNPKIFEAPEPAQETAVFHPNPVRLWPEKARVRQYFNDLADVKADPASVIAHAKDGQKTVFIDFGDSTNGFASFIMLYLAEARRLGQLEKLQEAASFHVYLQRPEKAANEWVMHSDNGQTYTQKITSQPLTDFCQMWATRLAASTNEFYATSPRIVPYYPLNENKAPRMPENAEHVAKMRGIVADEVARREASRHNEPPKAATIACPTGRAFL